MVLNGGTECFIAKCDLKDAYKSVNVRPADWHLLALRAFVHSSTEQHFFVQTTLPFGLRSSCVEFERIADAVQWVAVNRGTEHLWRYLDDFFIVAPSEESCNAQLAILTDTCIEAGFAISAEKLVRATKSLELLGLEINVSDQTIRLTDKRKHELVSALSEALMKSTMSLRELQSLTGKLNFAGRAVRPGRTFLRSFYALTHGCLDAHPSKHLNINRTVKSDMRWWLYLLNHWNGISTFRPSVWVGNADIAFYTDASLKGIGGVFGSAWFSDDLSNTCYARRDILWLKLYALTCAVSTWGEELRGRRILAACDNQAIVASINTGTVRNTHGIALLRALVFLKIRFSIELAAVYISTKDNFWADALYPLDVAGSGAFITQLQTTRRLSNTCARSTDISRHTHNSAATLRHLRSTRSTLLRQTLSASSTRTYRTAISHYNRFLSDIRCSSQPASVDVLYLFLSKLNASNVGDSSAKVYLAGIRDLHVKSFWPTNAFDDPIIKKILLAMNRPAASSIHSKKSLQTCASMGHQSAQSSRSFSRCSSSSRSSQPNLCNSSSSSSASSAAREVRTNRTRVLSHKQAFGSQRIKDTTHVSGHIKVTSQVYKSSQHDSARGRRVVTSASSKLAIKASDLSAFFPLLDMKSQHDACLWAAFCTGFQGLLRGSEYLVVPGRPLNDLAQLTWADVKSTKPFSRTSALSPDNHAISSRSMYFCIKKSKTDQSGRSTNVHFACTHSVVCAYCALANYMKLFSGFALPADSPFFIISGRPLTTTTALAHLRRLLNHSGKHGNSYSLHSFRAGGATAAALAGCSDGVIQALGRWSSDTFRRYIRPDIDSLLLAQQSMTAGPY